MPVLHRQRYVMAYMLLLCMMGLIFAGSVLWSGYNDVGHGAPPVVRGVSNLETWDFAALGPVSLTGDWEFYPRVFKEPRDSYHTNDVMGGIEPEYIDVPALWNTFKTRSEPMGPYGFGTYRMTAHINDTSIVYGFKIPDFATSYRMFVNGEEIAANGGPGISRETTYPEWRPQVVTFRPTSTQMEILVHVANFAHRKGGMWEPISFGSADQILRKRDLAIGVSLFTFGSLFIMGFYHLSVFSLRSDDRSSLFLGLFCLAIAFRAILTGEVFATTLFPHLNFELLAKLEYALGSLAMASFLAFMVALFPEDFFRPLLRFIYGSVIFSIAIIAICPLRCFARLLSPFQVILGFAFIWSLSVVIKRAHRRQFGAERLLTGSAILVATVLNDIAYACRLHSISGLSNTVPLGLLAFVFSQTLVIAERFSLALDTAEALTAELEDKVCRRTLELQDVNRQLELAATKDVLTMLGNRYDFQHTVERESLLYKQSPGADIVYSLMYLDLDNFKQFNDSFGHDVGDFILQQFAQILVRVIDEEEKAYRIGGDEFVVLLPGRDSKATQTLALKLAETLEQRRFPLDILHEALGISAEGCKPVTCSFGTSTYVQGTVFDLGKMLQAADRMMLDAKRSRRVL